MQRLLEWQQMRMDLCTWVKFGEHQDRGHSNTMTALDVEVIALNGSEPMPDMIGLAPWTPPTAAGTLSSEAISAEPVNT